MASRERPPLSRPSSLCSSAATEARNVLRVLREGAVEGDPAVPRRVRVELPLPPADVRTDEMRYLGLHGQAADWSGGMSQRLRVTKAYVEENMLDGYDWEYLGLLDRDADGMAVWTCGENMTVVTHPSDTTMRFFLDLADGVYGERVKKKDHVLVVVNAFWSGNGEKVGQPWEFGLKKRAAVALAPETGDWEKVYVARRKRSAAGAEGTLRRAWPGRWQLVRRGGGRVDRRVDAAGGGAQQQGDRRDAERGGGRRGRGGVQPILRRHLARHRRDHVTLVFIKF